MVNTDAIILSSFRVIVEVGNSAQQCSSIFGVHLIERWFSCVSRYASCFALTMVPVSPVLITL